MTAMPTSPRRAHPLSTVQLTTCAVFTLWQCITSLASSVCRAQNMLKAALARLRFGPPNAALLTLLWLAHLSRRPAFSVQSAVQPLPHNSVHCPTPNGFCCAENRLPKPNLLMSLPRCETLSQRAEVPATCSPLPKWYCGSMVGMWNHTTRFLRVRALKTLSGAVETSTGQSERRTADGGARTRS